jgi:lipoprotein-releasing system permease protein
MTVAAADTGLTAPAGNTRPFAGFEWLIALRYLRARRKEGFISVIAIFSFLGILLAVAMLIIVMAVMNGFHKEMIAKILGLDGHVAVVRQDTADFPDYRDYAKRLEAAAGVKKAIPLIEGQVLARTPRFSQGAKVRGLSEEGLKALSEVSKKDNIRSGTLDGFDGQEGIAIGVGLARLLGGVRAGSTISLLSPDGPKTPFGVSPRIKVYKIAAVFEMGMTLFDNGIIFMPLGEAQRFFGKGDAVDVLEVLVHDPEKVEKAVNAMADLGIPSLSFYTWKQRNLSFLSVLQVERNVMFIVLSIIFVVAAFNIISGLIMLVKDKGREIGILRTMGATQGAIMRVFLIIGASIGVVGTLAGFLVAVVFCWRIDEIRKFLQWVLQMPLFDANIYYLEKMPADLDWGTTGFIVAMALILSVLATLYPSWRASRLDPVEALRYE